MRIILDMLIIIIFCTLTGCQSNIEVPVLMAGFYYSSPESEEKRILPYLELYENNEFYLMDNVLNSERIIGSYEVSENHVILHSDKEQIFYFEINDKTLIFIADRSSQIKDIEDGTIFYLKDK